MNKKLKFASAFLAASLVVTPVSNLVSNFDNVAMAEDNTTINQINIKKHINYIDSQIYLENNNLKINKNIVLKYIQENFNELNINNQFNSPKEYYKNIELSIDELNKKVNSGWYKLNNDKSISQKYQYRYMYNGYERYDQWYGIQIYIHNRQGLENFIDEMTIAKNDFNTSLGAFIPILGSYRINVFTKVIENSRATFNLFGNVKVTLYKTGGADVERIK